MHRDGFAPALDAVARILHDGSGLFNSTVHEIDFAELPARLSPAIVQIISSTSTLRL